MNDISRKTTGQLMDELVTNAFKTAFAVSRRSSVEEFEVRYLLLRDALERRLGDDVAAIVHDLAVASFATWQAQEIVMSEANDEGVAVAARQAQRLNALRSSLIREIDRVLGEAGITITTKTYG